MEQEFFGGFVPSNGEFQRHRQRSPGWAAEMPEGFPPFVHKRLWERDHQQRPAVTPERNRADEIKRQTARPEKLCNAAKANVGPSKLFARGIRLAERSRFANRDRSQRTMLGSTGMSFSTVDSKTTAPMNGATVESSSQAGGSKQSDSPSSSGSSSIRS